LLGKPLVGSFSAHKSGHELNNKLLRKLVEKKSAWEQVEFVDKGKLPGFLHTNLQVT
jgi:UDP-3-O-[3-hydroxymyristoyl] N-acetylglucosamine deacetylase